MCPAHQTHAVLAINASWLSHRPCHWTACVRLLEPLGASWVTVGKPLHVSDAQILHQSYGLVMSVLPIRVCCEAETGKCMSTPRSGPGIQKWLPLLLDVDGPCVLGVCLMLLFRSSLWT